MNALDFARTCQRVLHRFLFESKLFTIEVNTFENWSYFLPCDSNELNLTCFDANCVVFFPYPFSNIDENQIHKWSALISIWQSKIMSGRGRLSEFVVKKIKYEPVFSSLLCNLICFIDSYAPICISRQSLFRMACVCVCVLQPIAATANTNYSCVWKSEKKTRQV